MSDTILYSKEHVYAKQENNEIICGISVFAQKELEDIVFVELPEVDTEVEQGDVVCTVDSMKSTSEIYAPVSGTITEVNETLSDSNNVSLVNTDPLNQGWIFKLKPTNFEDEKKELLTEEQYKSFIEE
ncbi:MAG: glycine cleavage system protein GcvH [Spirochaetia bacterium]